MITLHDSESFFIVSSIFKYGIPDDSRMTHSQFLRPENLTPELLAKLRTMSAEAQKNGQTLSDSALQWILNQRGVTSVLVGVSKVEQMEKNIKAVLGVR